MSDILCKWLNDELHVSKRISPANFAREFASGFLLGEVLYKYQLQNDFDQFSENRTSESKLNNFTRLEPMLHLLGIPFDTVMAREIMTEKHGTVTRLLYQMYIALNNKKKANLTGVAMETLQPAAVAKLGAMESEIFKQRLKRATPRQTDLDLQALIDRFQDHQTHMEQMAFKLRFEESERLKQLQQNERLCLIDRSRKMREKQIEIVAKIAAATVEIPKPLSNKTSKAVEARRQMNRKREAEETINAIHLFEEKLRAVLPPEKENSDTDLSSHDELGHQSVMMKMAVNDEYIGRIKKRLKEDVLAREEREKRRRKVLTEQMNAHLAQEESRREEMLVNRLMRQSQQERRIVVQLLQARREKEMIRQNRIFRERQFQERREKDFEEALDREAELAAFHRQEYADQIRADQELHNQIAAERADTRYRRHYNLCSEIVDSIMDFSWKVAEYREITNNLIPEKLFREWKLLFMSGLPLFETVEQEAEELSPERVLEEERQLLLDEGDFLEYKGMTGEWLPPESSEIKQPPRDNPVVSHIIQRLFNIVHPPTPPAIPPEMPSFPIRACILGKAFSGKTTCIKQLAKEHNLAIIDPETLLQEAIAAYENREMETADEEVQVSISEDFEKTSLSQDVLADTSEINESNNMAKGNPPSVTDITKEPPQPTEVSNVASETQQETIDLPEEVVVKPPRFQSHIMQLTRRAKLGQLAMRCLRKGKPVEDQVVVDILMEAISKIPEGTGFILDGYPRSYAQAKLLEKALSGCDVDRQEKGPKLSLIPKPVNQSILPPSGLDVVVLFDIRDELCLKRAAGRTEQIQAGKTFHEEFEPPPEGSATGIGTIEQVQPVTDPAYDEEQIQNRLTGFIDHWSKLKKWFIKFGTLKIVDASLEREAVFLETEKILEDTLTRLQQKDQPPPVEEAAAEEKMEQLEQQPPGGPPVETAQEPQKEEPAPGGPEVRPSRPSSKTGSAAGSAKSRSSSKDKKSRSPKGKKSDSSSVKKKAKKGSTAGQRKLTKAGEPEVQPEPEVPDAPPPPQPGDEEWIFVDSDIDIDLAKMLMSHWEEVEHAYIGNCKAVFRNIRFEREHIFRYLHKIRKDYIQLLRKPDCKQEYISQWQKTYNDVSDDMRGDDEVKAELHQQVDDLVEMLWKISDDRKEQAEQERETIMKDGWLEDHLGVLTNHYLTLMQAEIDRFQDTVRLLKDYYRGHEGLIPDVLNPVYERGPLVELPFEVPEPPERLEGEVSEEKISEKAGRQSKSPGQSPRDSKTSVTNIKNQPEKEVEKPFPVFPEEYIQRTIIPLVPRYSRITDSKSGKLSARESKEKLNKKPREDQSTESPMPAALLDDKQISDGFSFALNAISQIVSTEMLVKAAEEEADRLLEQEKVREREKAAKTTKGTKAGTRKASVSPKKPSKTKDTVDSSSIIQDLAVLETNEEEVQTKKLNKIKAREELYFAIEEEANAAKVRLDLIHILASAVLQDLKVKSDEAFKSMNDWLGTRFLKEMEGIDQMSLVLRDAIEHCKKFKHDIVFEMDNFIIDEDLKLVKTPSPEPPSTPKEEVLVDQFTVNQLKNFYEQIKGIAPNGIISKKAFTELFENLVSATHGTESLPDLWMQLTPAQIQELSTLLALDTDYIDWHRLLIALCSPIPSPTQQQLLDCLHRFRKIDQKNTGSVTREQWHWIMLWFMPDADSPEVFNRMAALKDILFDIFADSSGPIALLDYVTFLMYFSASANYHEGFLRALSVATGQHMPRLDKPPIPATAQVKGSRDSISAEGSVVRFEDKTAVEPPISDEVIPPEAQDAEVSLEALFKVLHHGNIHGGDSHRFSVTADQEEHTSIERLRAVFQELNDDDDDSMAPIMYRVLIEHPLIQDVIMTCKQFKAVDLKAVVSGPSPDITEVPSLKLLD